MSLDTAQAMWEEGNVNAKGQRVVLRYIRVTFGGQYFIPDLKPIKDGEICDEEEKMTNIGNYKSVAPVTDAIETDEKRVHYWTKPLVPLINFTVSNWLYQSLGKIRKDKQKNKTKKIKN